MENLGLSIGTVGLDEVFTIEQIVSIYEKTELKIELSDEEKKLCEEYTKKVNALDTDIKANQIDFIMGKKVNFCIVKNDEEIKRPHLF